jgi:phage tail sheath gpL-like
MPIPLAVAPSIITPGFYLQVNLLAGASAPSTGTLKCLLICPKASTGNLTVDTEIRPGAGPDSAATAYGSGTPGHLAAIQIYTQFPAAQVYFAAPTAGATAATLNITATGVPTSNTSVHFDVCGREFDVAWNSGETADTFKVRAIASINAMSGLLPATASSGGTGVITLTSKVTGKIGNDILVQVTLNLTQTGTEVLAGALVGTNLAGGTTDPDITTLLGNAAGTEYAFFAPCFSNAETELTTTNNVSRLLVHIGTYNSGLNASLQQAIVATVKTQANAKAAAIIRNSQVLEHVHITNARSLPCEIVGYEVGARLEADSLDPAANRIGEYMVGLYGSKTPTADKPTATVTEDSLTNGLSIVGYNSQLQLIILRPITTYSVDTNGNPDRRLLDVQNVSGTYAVARDMRSALPTEFANAKIQKDSLPGEDPPARGVIEERDIKGFVISRLRFWQRAGVVQKAALDSVIADGSLVVQVNASDATQVDITLPLKIVQPLAKMGVVVQRRPN